MAERFRQMSEDYESKGLATPFKGITTNGEVVPGLFEIKPSGVSTEPVRNAAEAFIATLTPLQLARTMYPVDDIEWRKWMNQHFYARQGVCFAEMTDAQRQAAFGLMRASLSAEGFELTRNIMRLNETLAELAGGSCVPGRVAVLHPDLRQAVGHRAVGLETRGPSRHHQLLRTRGPGGDDSRCLSAPNR